MTDTTLVHLAAQPSAVPKTVVVLGAGYAGVGVIQLLESVLDELDAELVWVSDHDHHFVLHEAHRIIREPRV